MTDVDSGEISATSRAANGIRSWWADRVMGVRAQGSRQWYVGAAFGLLYQAIMVIFVWTMPYPLWQQILASVLLAVFYAGFLFLPPMFWMSSLATRVVVVCVYWAYTLALFPILGQVTFWLWVLVGGVVATLCEEFLIVLSAVVVLVSVPLIYGLATDFNGSAAIASPIIFSVAAMMFGINRQIRAMRQLKAAQSEVARLAVVEERARFSRDMHDVIGHSLTVVTVKSELVKKLIRRDPDRAEEEVADIERLTRSALVDLRAAVAGYRQLSLDTEIAAAQAALSAANIRAHLPQDVSGVAPDLRELFGWVLREGVTNVIRHSGAENCWVEVSRDELTILDDGAGPDGVVEGQPAVSASGSDGSGLGGLSERARSARATLTTGVSEQGGFRLTVTRSRS